MPNVRSYTWAKHSETQRIGVMALSCKWIPVCIPLAPMPLLVCIWSSILVMGPSVFALGIHATACTAWSNAINALQPISKSSGTNTTARPLADLFRTWCTNIIGILAYFPRPNEPAECLAKAILTIIVECEKCGNKAPRVITDSFCLAWGLLCWRSLRIFTKHTNQPFPSETSDLIWTGRTSRRTADLNIGYMVSCRVSTYEKSI